MAGIEALRRELAEARGADLIAAERRRQTEAEGWTAEHDAEPGHVHALMSAGQAYMRRDHSLWPWDEHWWKPKGELRNLIRAGALFQAALDTGSLVALSGNAEGFRNVCARMIDTILAEASDVQLPVVERAVTAALAEAWAEGYGIAEHDALYRPYSDTPSASSWRPTPNPYASALTAASDTTEVPR